MITVFTRDDLIRESKDKDVKDIVSVDFRNNREPYEKADMVVFVDDNQVTVLKSRYGKKELEDNLNLIGVRRVYLKDF
jgi:hypothetical protein